MNIEYLCFINLYNLVSYLGDNESGKTTLVAKLQGEKETKKGAGLEYYYIDVKDDYRDGKAIYIVSHISQYLL